MRNIIFLILTICFSCVSYSQEVSKNEYEIYGTLIGEQGYQFYPITFGIPINLKLKILFFMK
ncbi:hypothetical protein C4F50_15840 [Flavobacterium sp. KB82]|uniref:Uncharacterized protein n=1 Tax=Flavobacterium hungaricum TaxID=2082725 RepID=A0ABR9TM28_9FLAO|nr:hypothetical protein [Flavobacterium hungaricum]